MRNKAPLAMMEQLIMLLVFALAAALCLQAFVTADQMSVRNAKKDIAIVQVQNAAETVKVCRGDLDAAAALLSGNVTDDVLHIPCECGEVVVTLTDSPSPLTESAYVACTADNGEELFAVNVRWQNGGNP